MKPKQIPLTGVPAAARMPLVLSGEPGVEFDLAAPWPMPAGGKWAPVPQKPLLAVWARIKKAVMT